MVLVLFILMAWVCVLSFVYLKPKLPFAVNALLFMAIEAVLTNKLTLISFNQHWFIMNQDPPLFMALILHNDLTVPFLLLIFVNLVLLRQGARLRLLAGAGTFLLLIGLGSLLRWTGVLKDLKWTWWMEAGMNLLLMGYVILIGWGLLRMARREGLTR